MTNNNFERLESAIADLKEGLKVLENQELSSLHFTKEEIENLLMLLEDIQQNGV